MPDIHRRRLLLGGARLAALPSLALAPLMNPQGSGQAHAAPTVSPSVEVGELVRLGPMPSSHITPRPVDVWIPPGLASAREPAVLLFMHDGQMLFDARTTWNRQAWNAHTAVRSLMEAGRIPPTIIVGVHNREGQRYAEYFPQKALAYATEAERLEYLRDEGQGRTLADAYLRHLVEEIKPQIEARWPVRKGPLNAYTAGASMGGLISLYAVCEHPQVFAGGACLSTHWLGRGTHRGLQGVRNEELPRALSAYMRQHLPAPGRHRLWIDRGDDALDSLYEPGLQAAAAVLRERGYTDQQATTRVFPGTGHNEAAWAARLGTALAFVMDQSSRGT